MLDDAVGARRAAAKDDSSQARITQLLVDAELAKQSVLSVFSESVVFERWERRATLEAGLKFKFFHSRYR